MTEEIATGVFSAHVFFFTITIDFWSVSEAQTINL